MTDRRGKVRRNKPRRTDPNAPVVRKVPADSVPYGESISHNKTLWAAFDGERLVCVAVPPMTPGASTGRHGKH